MASFKHFVCLLAIWLCHLSTTHCKKPNVLKMTLEATRFKKRFYDSWIAESSDAASSLTYKIPKEPSICMMWFEEGYLLLEFIPLTYFSKYDPKVLYNFKPYEVVAKLVPVGNGKYKITDSSVETDVEPLQLPQFGNARITFAFSMKYNVSFMHKMSSKSIRKNRRINIASTEEFLSRSGKFPGARLHFDLVYQSEFEVSENPIQVYQLPYAEAHAFQFPPVFAVSPNFTPKKGVIARFKVYGVYGWEGIQEKEREVFVDANDGHKRLITVSIPTIAKYPITVRKEVVEDLDAQLTAVKSKPKKVVLSAFCTVGSSHQWVDVSTSGHIDMHQCKVLVVAQSIGRQNLENAGIAMRNELRFRNGYAMFLRKVQRLGGYASGVYVFFYDMGSKDEEFLNNARANLRIPFGKDSDEAGEIIEGRPMSEDKSKEKKSKEKSKDESMRENVIVVEHVSTV